MSEVIWLVHDDAPPTVDFYCSDCDLITEGFSLCLKCNPQTYMVNEMTDDNLDDTQRYKAMVDKVNKSTDADIAKCGQSNLPSQLHKEIWNSAIEKAALETDKIINHIGYGTSERIRSLKI